jgi:hypothetical protein
MCYGNPAVSSFQGGASSAVWLTAGYSYVYHLNELSNATAIDSSGALNSSSNLSTQTAGLIGYGQNFSSSSSQGITFPDMPAARGVTQISISGWQQRSFSSANAGFGLSNSTATTAFEPLLYGYTNGYGIASNASGVSSSYNNSLAFAGTGWIHTALIFDGTQSTNDGRLKFYVNGQLQIPPSYFGTIPASMYSGTLPGVIGVFSSGPGYTTCDCSQDEVRYAAGIILRADWILAEYNNQSSPATFYSGL